MTNTREEIRFYEPIAKDEDGTIIMLDYVFKDGTFQGATGSRFCPVSKAEYEERTSLDSIKERFEDCWREAVRAGTTEQGLDGWCEMVLRGDGDEAVFDLSYSNTWDKIRKAFPEYSDEEKYPLFECVGGGRMFTANNNFKDIVRQDLIDLIREYELPNETTKNA